MLDYDFEILQYNEFECLTRDLLQAEFKVFIESFTDGRDGGIDLRFGNVKGGKTIVQVKRYKDWRELKPILTSEVEKVRKLNPQRYIFSTSAGLTPKNKEEIVNIFSPYIKDTSDILGRNDINNLLGKYPDIEKKYYKLWLGSTNVLQDIINKGVLNWSDFELETIREQVSSYVMNNSFNEAYEILKKNSYVIISGIPGIGKTTLARMLVYDILAHGYEQFICITDDLEAGTKSFVKGKKQVFFFDDFLGDVVFNPKDNFDKKLICFIDAVKREKDKLFILTTREYILSDAKSRYEKFEINNIEIAKCTVDLGSYTKYIRAKILYNHIAGACLPNAYIEDLLRNKNYMRLVDHINFNPRIIETFIDNQLWKSVSPEKFVERFLEFFDNPTRVWEYAFNNLKINARYALLLLVTLGSNVDIELWFNTFHYFCVKTKDELNLVCDNKEWNDILKLLENCFIKTNRQDSKIIVAYFNPSIRSFIVKYLEENKYTQKIILSNIYCVQQLYKVFRDLDPISFIGFEESYINVDNEMFEIVLEQFSKYLNTRVDYKYILQILAFIEAYPKHLAQNKGWLEKHIPHDALTSNNVCMSDRINLMSKLDLSLLDLNIIDVFDEFDGNVSTLYQFSKLFNLYGKLGLLDRIQSPNLIDKLKFCCYREIDENVYNNSSLDFTESSISSIDEQIPDDGECLSEVWEYLEEMKDEINEPEIEYDEDYYRESHFDYNDNVRIDEMMTCLREK